MAKKPGKGKGKIDYDLTQNLGFSLSSDFIRQAVDGGGNGGGGGAGGGGGGCCCCCCCCCGSGSAQLQKG